MTKLTFSDKACYRKRNACFLAGKASLPVAGCQAPARDRNSGLLSITMQFLLIALIMLNAGSWLSANTLKVALDGSQPYSVIQEAINASVNGDTVLVYPGRYIENVDYNGKNITLASLELITGNPAYRDSTIIDGNQNGSVIKSTAAISIAEVRGFTLTNGTGTPEWYLLGFQIELGGAMWIKNAQAFNIVNCIITGNAAYWGGGIILRSSTAHLSGTLITENYATDGGGLYLAGDSSAVFDQDNRCSVYNNTSGGVQDIVASESRLFSYIYLDIGSVHPINDYYILYRKSSPYDPGGFPVIDVQQGYRTEVNHDLYVSPLGDDNNDGVSPETPLRNIYRAMQFIYSDSIDIKTIHISSGLYSSSDGQFFPVAMKPHVKLSGSSDSMPVLMNLNYRETITASRAHNARIENIIIDYGANPHGGIGLSVTISDSIKLKNIHILPHQSDTWKGIVIGSNSYYPVSCTLEDIYVTGQTSTQVAGLIINTSNAILKGLTIEGCHNTGIEIDNPLPTFYFYGNKLTLENSKIINNTMDYDDMSVVSIGMRNADSNSRLIMNNVLIANNQSGGYTPVFIAAYTDSTSIISNCTFANNSGSNIASILNGNLRIANCIFDSDAPVEILCQGTYPNTVSHVSFENNFIRGYPNSFSSSAVNQISFNDVVLTGDPGFCSGIADDPMSYRLGNSSQCREAGTPDTTGLYLPEYDLYGNQRVFGSAIDIGCNEWNFPVSSNDLVLPVQACLSAYPNPFLSELKISFNLDKASNVQLKVYNLKGQMVSTIRDDFYSKGDNTIFWEGCDYSGKPVAPGIYILQFSLNGKAQKALKLVKL